MIRRSSGTVLVAVLLVLSASVSLADWSRFRGPNGSGISLDEQEPPTEWSSSENLKWKVPLPGPGSSSPIVVGGRVFVTCWSGYGVDAGNPGDQSSLRRHLICINAESGETVWDKAVEPYLPEDTFRGMFTQHGYASHTPVSDGQHVYAFFGKTGLIAFDMDGNQLWQTSVGTESGARDWGTASSPILYEDLVIVPATAESEALIALDKATGKEVWRQEAAGFNSVWGSPVLVKVDEERTDLVIAVPGEIWALDPATGKLRWYCDGVPASSFCSSAVAKDGIVYAIESGPGGGGGIAVRAGGSGDVTDSHVIWSGGQTNRIGTPIIHEGKLYVFANKIFTCYDAATGDEVHKSRLTSSSASQPAGSPAGRGGGFGGGRGGRGGMGGQDYASLVLTHDKFYITQRNGEICVVQLGDDFKQLAANRLTDDSEDFSATPAIQDDRLYIRSSKHLYCVGND